MNENLLNSRNNSDHFITINAQYIKDLSFEYINPLESFIKNKDLNSDVSLEIKIHANRINNNFFEVVLYFQLILQDNNKEITVFIIELSYAGIVTLNNNSKKLNNEENIKQILIIEVPYLLFPFARNILSNITSDSGFPIYLNPIDFRSLYYEGKLAFELNNTISPFVK